MRRRLRRWLRRVRVRPPALWYHPSFRLPVAGVESATGMDPRRADDVLTWALHTGMVRPGDVRTPDEISWEDAALVHTSEYLASLDEPETLAAILGVAPEVVPVVALLDLWRRATGATVAAARHAVRSRQRAMVLLGGFHHAAPDHGSGFCALNDLAIAIAVLRRDGVVGRITVLDLDAHPPDGVVACVRSDADVDVLSLGIESEWTVPAAGAACHVVDRRVPRGTGDEPYLEALDAVLAELQPSALVLYLAGADPLAADPLGGLDVSEAALRERDRRVLRLVGRTPVVVAPGGGYLDDSWRVIAGALAELAGEHRPVVPGWDPMLHRTREVAARLDPESLAADGPWLTEDELLASMGVTGGAGPSRFLGYYTRHGLEYALTEYGYLPMLREMGFDDIELEVLAGEYPHRLRITAPVRGTREPLVDLSVSVKPLARDNVVFQLLFVEWLELRDPRLQFTDRRPRLPGQESPGLGLAEETGHLLLRAAERLRLDGVGLVPSHYHVAAMSGARFEVVDPEHRGRFRALRRALADLPLLEATHALAGPGLAVTEGEPVRWDPVWMAIPVSPTLASWLAEGEPEARAAEEALRARLVEPARAADR